MVIANRLTPLSKAEAKDAFARAWRAYWGQDPTRNQLAMCLAHAWIETGFASIHNWNFGNVKGKPGGNYDIQYYRCNEILQGKVVWFNPPDPACCFRAYLDPMAGALAHLIFIAEGRYESALDAMAKGDPAAYAAALKARGYYTDTIEHYTAMCVSAFKAFKATIAEDAGETITDEDRAHVASMVWTSLADLYQAADSAPSANA